MNSLAYDFYINFLWVLHLRDVWLHICYLFCIYKYNIPLVALKFSVKSFKHMKMQRSSSVVTGWELGTLGLSITSKYCSFIFACKIYLYCECQNLLLLLSL